MKARRVWAWASVWATGGLFLSFSAPAAADDAVVTVGHNDGGFAEPPPRQDPVAVDPRYAETGWAPERERPEPYRSPVRLQVGPSAVTTGQNLGLGLGIAADFGTGSVGARVAAAWLRTGENSDANESALGTSLGQYTGELTLDFHKRGPVHPVFGIGFGLAHVEKASGAGNLGIGTARVGVEYALGLEDADVRIGGGITGVLPGPADREVQDLRGYALLGAGISIGF
jgi:hypothetical protein